MTTEEITPRPDPSMPWADRVIIRTEVGSTAHGTGLPGGEDYDEMGVVLERWESSVGLFPDADNIVYRPGRTITQRSEPGDYDLVLYTPQKFARLAASGNPSVLMMIFGPLRFSTPLGDQLRALAPAFWSDRARTRFLGYSRAQRDRLLGIRGGAHTNRPELVERFGFDTKYAMHMVRLGIQGIEYATSGRLILPIPEPHGTLLRDVRLGKYTRDEVIAMADANEAKLESMEGSAPAEPNCEAINAWLLDCHRAMLL
jgi:hypothetical protein